MSESISHIQNILDTKDVYLTFSEFKDSTYTVRKTGSSPCRVGCPIDTDIKAYLGLLAAGKFDAALETIKRDNPFPGICGRVCVHPCESECDRGEIDQPLAICFLKRFLADYDLKKGRSRNKPIKITQKKTIAIVGSGPAGLTAANDLIRRGYRVTVFESLPQAGGMLYAAIPEYRLPKNIIRAKIRAIEELGVEIRTNTKIDNFNDLRKGGYNALFLAIGTYKGLKLMIPGEDEFEGQMDCLTFLRDFNLTKETGIGKKVIIVGGGNAAIDSARTALRLQSDVHIVYRRSRAEMPANEWEIEEAEREGVNIHYLVSPLKIVGERGKVTALECIKNRLGPPDASGRRRPVPIEGSEFVIEADTIIPAISQRPDLSLVTSADHVPDISKDCLFVVNEDTLETNIPGIFAGGDCVTGPRTVIEAIAAGHKAAQSIEGYLRGGIKLKDTKLSEKIEFEVVMRPTEKKERAFMPEVPLHERKDFREVTLGFTEETALNESLRCLRCGFCAECSECIPGCGKRLTALSIQGDIASILLRIPADRDVFPLKNSPLEGTLSWEDGDKVPVTLTPITATVREEFCRGCGKCQEICEYSAPALYEKRDGIFVSMIDELACKGCGTCASVCPSSAITMGHFTESRLIKLMEIGAQLSSSERKMGSLTG